MQYSVSTYFSFLIPIINGAKQKKYSNLHNYHMCNADSSIDAPPSFKPAKRYSDLSGLLV